ncbi:hypothetical protein D5086_025642 [Populus alba]|uniref:Uncharacterized protein n=1 Tax=Populus alba TaxID=43335 RepID=A0ACC4AZS6_POPAL
MWAVFTVKKKIRKVAVLQGITFKGRTVLIFCFEIRALRTSYLDKAQSWHLGLDSITNLGDRERVWAIRSLALIIAAHTKSAERKSGKTLGEKLPEEKNKKGIS